MPKITLLKPSRRLSSSYVLQSLSKKAFLSGWIRARKSKFDEQEVEIVYLFKEPVEEVLKRFVSSEEYSEIVRILQLNGKFESLRRVFMFYNERYGIFEVYRGLDGLTRSIVQELQNVLKVKLEPLKIPTSSLMDMINHHSAELKQAMFKNVDGFWYTMLRGPRLEVNENFRRYLERNVESLRVVSIKPKIRFLTKPYTVTINADKGTLSLPHNHITKWRPRFEIRQIIHIISSSLESIQVAQVQARVAS